MKEIPTPETDAFSVSFKSIDDQLGKKQWVPVDLARRLERERNEERETVESLTTTAFDLLEQLGKDREQRDEARNLADRYRVAFCSARGDLVPQVFPWEEEK